MVAKSTRNCRQMALWKREEEKNLPKISYPSLFWLFMLGSVLGFVLEGVWCIFTKGHWEHHAATVWGPFCIIYGIGAVAVYLLSILLQHKGLPIQFFAFTAAGAVIEYFSSLFQEFYFHSVSWNYSAHFLNLGGRVSLKMSLLWGILGIAFMWLIFPLLNRLLVKMQGKGWKITAIMLTAFMAVNLAVTAAAVIRWHNRTTGDVLQASRVAQFLDAAYNDDTMARLFPNMMFCSE